MDGGIWKSSLWILVLCLMGNIMMYKLSRLDEACVRVVYGNWMKVDEFLVN